MLWNWQQPDWPEFAYDLARLRSCEDRFLQGAGMTAGALAHLGQENREGLTISLIAQEGPYV